MKLNTCKYNDADKLDNFDWGVVCKWPDFFYVPGWVEGYASTVMAEDCSKCKCYERRKK